MLTRKSAKVAPFEHEEQVSQGFFVRRRTVLAGLGAALLTPVSRASAADGEAGLLTFEQFLAESNPVAQELVGDVSPAGQARYLRSIAAIASRLQGAPEPGRWGFSEQGSRPESYEIGFVPGGEPFRVLQWRLEPGASCRAHAHTYGNVVTIGLEGSALVRNFEVVGEPDYNFGGTFMARRTMEQLLLPGSFNLVSLHRNYIHEVTAGPDGARGLDITTPLLPRPEHGTPYLAMASRPTGGFDNAFEASWEFGA